MLPATIDEAVGLLRGPPPDVGTDTAQVSSGMPVQVAATPIVVETPRHDTVGPVPDPLPPPFRPLQVLSTDVAVIHHLLAVYQPSSLKKIVYTLGLSGVLRPHSHPFGHVRIPLLPPSGPLLATEQIYLPCVVGLWRRKEQRWDLP